MPRDTSRDATNSEDQLELLPPTRRGKQRKPVYKRVPLDQLVWDGYDPGRRFVENLRSVGIMNPIAVVKSEEEGVELYGVIAGRRRATAAKELEMETVPVAIYPAGTPMSVIRSMSLSENLQRSANFLHDLKQIESLVLDGFSPERIARELHVPLGSLNSRLKLTTLIGSLRYAVRNGMLSVALAKQAAKLPVLAQQWLNEVLRELYRAAADQEASEGRSVKPRLTAEHLREAKRRFVGDPQEEVQELFSREDEERFRAQRENSFPPESFSIRIGESGVPIPHPSEELRSAFDAALHSAGREEAIRLLASQETWEATILLLEAASRAMPVEPNDDADRFYGQIEDLIAIARRRMEATSRRPTTRA